MKLHIISLQHLYFLSFFNFSPNAYFMYSAEHRLVTTAIAFTQVFLWLQGVFEYPILAQQ